MSPTPNSDNTSMSRIIREKMRPIMAIVAKDMKQIRRHGLLLLVSLSFVLLFIGLFLFTSASSEFEKRGVPTWTGGVLSGQEVTGPPQVEIMPDTFTGTAPLTVTFEATIVGGEEPFTYSWEFGDESDVSNEESPTHTYSDPGTYGCYLMVEGGSKEPVTTSKIWILVTDVGEQTLLVAISANVTEGSPPMDVKFFSAVAGGMPPYTSSWDLGDGNSSNEANPTHSYENLGEYTVNLTVQDSEGNVSISGTVTIELSEEEGGGLPLTLLDMTFGYAVIVTMILITVAFSTGYNHEMKKGTVRTLTCYPIGVLEMTIAKLLYAAIVGLIFAGIVFFLPALSIEKPGGDVALIFLTAYLLSLITVAIGALLANSLTLTTKRMYLRPTTLPYILVVLSFLFTENILKGIATFLELMGAGIDPDSVAQGMGPLIALSPYHQGGALLSAGFGGPGSPIFLIFLVPVALLALGIWFSKRLYPDIYVRE